MQFKPKKYPGLVSFSILVLTSLSATAVAECIPSAVIQPLVDGFPANSFTMTILCTAKNDQESRLIKFHAVYDAIDTNTAITGTPQTLRLRVVGTREQPDPVETKIRELEQAGQLRVLRVLESFPQQFEIEGSAEAVGQVQAVIRK